MKENELYIPFQAIPSPCCRPVDFVALQSGLTSHLSVSPIAACEACANSGGSELIASGRGAVITATLEEPSQARG